MLVVVCLIVFTAIAQKATQTPTFTKADSLRGGNNSDRNWWDVIHYHIQIEPNIAQKTINGSCTIQYIVRKHGKRMQIDLQDGLMIDSVIADKKAFLQNGLKSNLVSFYKRDGVYYLDMDKMPERINSKLSVRIYYHGKPREAVNAPWDGGWVWSKDGAGNPWISVACQSLGASSWYPCKDMQSDEPDSGANLSITVPDTLQAVSNGRLVAVDSISQPHLRTFHWQVNNPINNYTIIPYIGKYTLFSDTLMGEKGILTLQYWVLPADVEKAKEQFKQVKPMLHCFEYWFGAYPFYEDGYQLIQAPYLGMENQSAVAYGNRFANGYLGRDLSTSGWGLKWDFIIVHESGHEWFGNSITTKDIADMWVHEGFTNYSETLFTEWLFGKEAGNDYSVGIRKKVANDIPIIGHYGVNNKGSEGDMYYKASNLVHNLRHLMNNDSLFRASLRKMNRIFYHQTVSTEVVEKFWSKQLGYNLQKVFDQYLRTTKIPNLVLKYDTITNKLGLQWTNCVEGFDMPIVLSNTGRKIKVTTSMQTFELTSEDWITLTKQAIERAFFVYVRIKN